VVRFKGKAKDEQREGQEISVLQKDGTQEKRGKNNGKSTKSRGKDMGKRKTHISIGGSTGDWNTGYSPRIKTQSRNLMVLVSLGKEGKKVRSSTFVG